MGPREVMSSRVSLQKYLSHSQLPEKLFIITPTSGSVRLLPPLSMALPLRLTPLTPLRTTAQPGIGIDTQTPANPKHIQANSVFQHTPPVKTLSLITKAANNSNRNTKPNSVICADCDGNGAVPCSQCKGSGVNSADLFNGQFRAGESCWLCGGRKEMLCGNCNGAGFIGGFLSTYDQ